jgi:hypothetical protein
LIDVRKLHRKLASLVADFCPALRVVQSCVHRRIMQLEYAANVVIYPSRSIRPAL